MPPLPGEERLVTVYADIHYYFAPPSVRPVLHRFDKACYFYIYYNSTRQTGRIEVANNAGTPDQDAFNGFLDNCRIINSHRFPTLVTLVVDAAGSASSSPTSRSGRDPDEWRLASNDPRDTGKTKYRLHTLDIYFWTEEDSKLVVDTFKRLLQPTQLDVAELEPDPESTQARHQDTVNPVVQNLENVAITDPAYQNGQTRNSQSQPQQPTTNLPPPPPQQQQQPPATEPYKHASSVSPVSAMSKSDAKTGKTQEPAQNFAPMAYNPAAPAAPEPIAHREDTPPPPDDGQGTGLAAAAAHDTGAYGRTQSQPWTGVPQPGQAYQIGQPQTHAQTYGSPPAPSAAPPFAGPPTGSIGSDGRHQSVAAQSYVPSPPDAHAQMYSQHPVETPGAQFYSTNPGQPHKPLQHVQPQYADYLSSGTQQSPPPGGYSQYSYGQNQSVSNPYDVHSQVYRPTEVEHGAHHRKPSRTESTPTKSKWDQRQEKAEKGVSKLFKKIEKKIG